MILAGGVRGDEIGLVVRYAAVLATSNAMMESVWLEVILFHTVLLA